MKYKDDKGYSLVEVLVVIGIIMVVAAIAMPIFQAYAINRNLRSAARDIIGDIFSCKERTIAENRQYRISFNVGANNYTIDRCNTTGSSCAAYTAIQTKTPTAFGSDISITNAAFGNNSAISFQTRGTSESGNVVLTNSRGSTATITTNITGRAGVTFNMQ
jgi:prepilin-type N-terminal cleavage/methylation domain-containing protein